MLLEFEIVGWIAGVFIAGNIVYVRLVDGVFPDSGVLFLPPILVLGARGSRWLRQRQSRHPNLLVFAIAAVLLCVIFLMVGAGSRQ